MSAWTFPGYRAPISTLQSTGRESYRGEVFRHRNQVNLLRYPVLPLLGGGKRNKPLDLSVSQFSHLENRDEKVYLARILYKLLK